MSRSRHMRFLIDRLARTVIVVGGLATILSILGIFFFLFREVTPLFATPTAKMTQHLILPFSVTTEAPMQLAVDEHREIAHLITSDGVQFIEVASGQPLPIALPAELKNMHFTAMAHGGGSCSPLCRGYGRGPGHVAEGRHDNRVLQFRRAPETPDDPGGSTTHGGHRPCHDAGLPVQRPRDGAGSPIRRWPPERGSAAGR